MECPTCGLINPPSALVCDCGYSFESQVSQAAINADQRDRGTEYIAQAGEKVRLGLGLPQQSALLGWIENPAGYPELKADCCTRAAKAWIYCRGLLEELKKHPRWQRDRLCRLIKDHAPELAWSMGVLLTASRVARKSRVFAVICGVGAMLLFGPGALMFWLGPEQLWLLMNQLGLGETLNDLFHNYSVYFSVATRLLAAGTVLAIVALSAECLGRWRRDSDHDLADHLLGGNPNR